MRTRSGDEAYTNPHHPDMIDAHRQYKATLTKAHFLYTEMRITASLMLCEASIEKVREIIVTENLYQYPTFRSLKEVSNYCCNRIKGMDASHLIADLAEGSSHVAKQICLYAMMKESRLLCEFMVDIIGEKYRTLDYHITHRDFNDYFSRLSEQNANVAKWSPKTVTKLKSVISRVLTECEYIDSGKSTELKPIRLAAQIEETIRNKHEHALLQAFNIFS